MGSHYVAQAGLDLLNSGDFPASASQTTEITGVSHHAWPIYLKCDVLTGSCSVAQSGVQWHNHGSLHPSSPGLKQCSHLSPLNSWTHRHVPLCLANFLNYLYTQSLAMSSSHSPSTSSISSTSSDCQHCSTSDSTTGVSLCCPGWRAVMRSQLTVISISQAQSILLPQSSWYYRHVPPYLAIFVFVEMVFCHVAQAGLELLTSSDPPSSASQSTGITGMNYYPRPYFIHVTFVHKKSLALSLRLEYSGIISFHCKLRPPGS
ncbi:UPF0764 protein C16orf89, partial [Plecturocebus cupreus]